jgi:hypothetical protein
MHFRLFFIAANEMMRLEAIEELRLIKVINAERTGDEETFDSISERIHGKEKVKRESSKQSDDKAKVKKFLNAIG